MQLDELYSTITEKESKTVLKFSILGSYIDYTYLKLAISLSMNTKYTLYFKFVSLAMRALI